MQPNKPARRALPETAAGKKPNPIATKKRSPNALIRGKKLIVNKTRVEVGAARKLKSSPIGDLVSYVDPVTNVEGTFLVFPGDEIGIVDE